MTKTALVTGSAGFIGRHMVRELVSQDYIVHCVDPAEKNYNRGDSARWSWNTGATEWFSPSMGSSGYYGRIYDLVVHCAFHVGGRAAIDGTNMNFAKNLQLDSAMFDWAVRTKQKQVLYFSSSAAYPVVYQMTDGINLREDLIDASFPEYPDANYGQAKLTGERLAEDARRSGLSVTVVRPFSGYGEDQSTDYPFPSIVARAAQGDLSVWGPPGQTRDWIHVDDVVRGSLAVVESSTEDPVNLCTGRGVEMGQLARMVANQAGIPQPNGYSDYGRVMYLPDRPTGVLYRVGDPTRFNQYYTPQVTLEEGIRRALSV